MIYDKYYVYDTPIRGGHWKIVTPGARVNFRGIKDMDEGNYFIGLRIVRRSA